MLIQELASFINNLSDSLIIVDPLTLIGKKLNHKFKLEDFHLEKWYSETVTIQLVNFTQLNVMVKKIIVSMI